MSDGDAKATTILLRPLRKDLETLDPEEIFKDLILTEYHYVERVLKILAEDLVKRLQVFNELNQTILKQEEITLIFSNTDSLYSFHRNLLNELTTLHYASKTSADFSKSVKSLIPFYKLYAMYLNNLQQGCNELSSRANIAANFHSFLETTEELHRVAIIKVFLAPVYRLPQYLYYFGLLYSKAEDKEVRTAWKEVIVEIVNILNGIVERFKDATKKNEVLDIQREFGNSVELVSPSRYVVKSGELLRHNPSRKLNKTAPSLLVVFNDQLIFGTKAKSKYLTGKIKEVMPLQIVKCKEVPDGSYENLSNCFQVINTNTNKAYFFVANNPREQSEWINTISSAVSDYMRQISGKQDMIVQVKQLSSAEKKDNPTDLPDLPNEKPAEGKTEAPTPVTPSGAALVNYFSSDEEEEVQQDVNAYELAKICMWRYKEFLDFFIFLNF